MAENQNPGQIWVRKTGKKLIELNDKLSTTGIEDYGHLHSKYSKVQIAALDYSEGTQKDGKQSVWASHNLDPDVVRRLAKDVEREIFLNGIDARLKSLADGIGTTDRKVNFVISLVNQVGQKIAAGTTNIGVMLTKLAKAISPEELTAPPATQAGASADKLKEATKPVVFAPAPAYSYQEEKLLSFSKDDEGRSPVTKFSLQRIGVSNTGEVRRQPWVVSVERGTAIAQTTATGGVAGAKGSYKRGALVTVTLTDDEALEMFQTAERFISVWEVAMGSTVIRNGVKAAADARAAEKGAQHE